MLSVVLVMLECLRLMFATHLGFTEISQKYAPSSNLANNIKKIGSYYLWMDING